MATIARRHVDQCHGGGERRHPAYALGVEGPRRPFNDLKPPDPGRDQHADVGRFGGDIEARIGHRLARGGHREVDVGGAAASFLAAEDGRGVETLHLAGDVHGEHARVEVGDRGDATSAGADRVPALGSAVAYRRDRAHPGDDDATPALLRHSAP